MYLNADKNQKVNFMNNIENLYKCLEYLRTLDYDLEPMNIVLEGKNNTNCKSKHADLARYCLKQIAAKSNKTLNVNDDSIDSFIDIITTNVFTKWLTNNNYIVKSVELDKRNVVSESMSFPFFNPCDIVTNEFQDEKTLFHDVINKEFILVVSKQDENGKILLKKIVFHKFNDQQINNAKHVYDNTKKILESTLVLTYQPNTKDSSKGIFKNNLPKQSEKLGFHVRPHGRDKMDTAILPACTMIKFENIDNYQLNENNQKFVDWVKNKRAYTKMAFWIDKSLIQEIIGILPVKKNK